MECFGFRRVVLIHQVDLQLFIAARKAALQAGLLQAVLTTNKDQTRTHHNTVHNLQSGNYQGRSNAVELECYYVNVYIRPSIG